MNGVLNVYKEKGYTSFDVVARLRGILHIKKIGHTGTLDPDATGVLPVCVGNATKLCDFLTDKSKEYEAVMLLGRTSDTYDASGVMLTSSDVSSVSEDDVREAILSFVPGYDQIPPMYSAKKVNGKKLYELARAGKEIERTPVYVEIPHIEVVDISMPRARFKVECSKGTYIRSLINDIGAKLGCGALMEELVRTRVSGFTIDSALKLDEIENLRDAGRLDEVIMPTDATLNMYGRVDAKREADVLLANGNKLPLKLAMLNMAASNGNCRTENPLNTADVCNKPVSGNIYRVYNSVGDFIGLYKYDGADTFKPYKMFLGGNT